MASEDSNIFKALESQSEAAEPMSTRERWMAWIDLWIIAPARIMWIDRRTRIGSIIVALYLLTGSVGVWLTEEPELNEAPPLRGPFPGGIVPGGQESWLVVQDTTLLGLTVPWPTLNYVFGTNNTGQDIFELLVHATPPMLEMALVGGIATTLIGVVVGTFAGYKGGRIERLLMTATDIQMAVPGLPLLIVLAVAIEPQEPWVVGLLLSVDAWAGLSRSLHSQVLALRSESYVEASRVLGLGEVSILRDDILPNIMPFIMINFMGNTIRVIAASVGLYFLGVLPYTTANWGVMTQNAYSNGAMLSADTWHWLFLPIFAISLLGYGIIMISQGMDRVFNPRVRARQSSTSEGGEAVAAME
jgi:peptide/nickel transport system permease protein